MSYNRTNLMNADLSGSTEFANSNLAYAILTGATIDYLTDLSHTILTGVSSGKVTYVANTTVGVVDAGPKLPPNWSIIKGYLVGPGANLINANLSGTAPAVAANQVGTAAVPASANYVAQVGTAAIPASSDYSPAVTAATAILTDMSNLKIYGADFTGANLSYVRFTGSGLATCIFSGANIIGSVFSNCNLDQTVFSSAIFSNATTFKKYEDNTVGRVINDDKSASLSGIISGRIIDSSNNIFAYSASTNAERVIAATKLPRNWEIINGYLVGPSANLINAEL